METKCLTVAIPCYNAERWVKAAIESALEQKVDGEVEVRVGDDGSGDDSLRIARSFGDRIVCDSWENQGGGYARNRLLESAQGKWIQYLDADDYLQKEKVRRQLDAAGKEPADVIYSPVWVQQWRAERPMPLTQTSLDASRDLYCQWFSTDLPQIGGSLWRREALEKIGGWNETMPCCQDYELYMRAIQWGLRFTFAPRPGAVYRVWSENTVSRKDPVKVILVRDQLFDQMISWMSENGIWEEAHRRAAGRTCFEMARTWAKYDLDAATAYFNRKKDEGLIAMEGPAAPMRYRYFAKTFGFRRAEQMARRSGALPRRGKPACDSKASL